MYPSCNGLNITGSAVYDMVGLLGMPSVSPLASWRMTDDSITVENLIVETVAPWDGRRVPVTLIGGYLGAGKTTAINEFLHRTDRPVAVLVNDVGEINVDSALIKRRHGDTLELTDGCVCCSLAEGLANAFDSLRARDHAPDHVVLELSGVADPARVAPWADSDGFRLDGIVVLIDAEQFLDRLDDDRTSAFVANQLRAADLFVITKTDIADEARIVAVEERLTALQPEVPIRRGRSAQDAGALLDAGTRRPGGVAATPAAQLFDPHTVETRTLPTPVSPDELDALLDSLPPGTVRAKGVALSTDGNRLLVQQVGRRRRVTPLPQAEDQEPTDLIVIRL